MTESTPPNSPQKHDAALVREFPFAYVRTWMKNRRRAVTRKVAEKRLAALVPCLTGITWECGCADSSNYDVWCAHHNEYLDKSDLRAIIAKNQPLAYRSAS